MIDVKLESVRRDIQGYTLGLLWLLALIAGLVTQDDVGRAAIFIDALAQQMNHVAVPPFAVGFLVAVIGVLLPYCMFQVFEPLTLAVLNLCLKLSRASMDSSLTSAAEAAMKNSLGVDLAKARDRREVFVESFLPRLARSLALEHQINAFRWKALVPASALTATLTVRISAAHIPAPWHWIIGTAIGLLVFVPGVMTAIRQQREEIYSLDVAVLVAAKDSAKPPQ